MAGTVPKISEVRALHEQLGERVLRTPVIRCQPLEAALGNASQVTAKLEFLQRTGTFKARGALASLLALSPEQIELGVTAVSAGNHAIATAFAANMTGATAKVVMTASANPSRVEACRFWGGEVVLADDVHKAFDLAERIQEEEGRYFVHPFEGPAVALGTGTVGLEMCEQIADFDVLVVSVGGGGLIGGIANAVRQLRPDVRIVGVEPEGADTMHRSFASGRPEKIDAVRTIADSLGSPRAEPYSFELVRANVDDLVMVSDDEIRRAMGFLFHSMKVAVEPACAATTAALFGPLREECAGKHVAHLMCGSNIDWKTFASQADLDHVAG